MESIRIGLLDGLLVVGYLLISAIIGLWAGRKAIRTADEFFFAHREARWPLIGASLFSANISSQQFVGQAGAVALVASGDESQVPKLTARRVEADKPAEKAGDQRFRDRHAQNLALARNGGIGLLFLGDSITERWGTAPEIFADFFGAWQPANFGIGGDETQHVLWRIANGELAGIEPKVVVLLIGTNNTASHSAPEISAAIEEILGQIKRLLPQAKIMLLGLLPRGPRLNQYRLQPEEREERDAAARMAVIREVNRRIAGLSDGTIVRYLDVSAGFVDADGRIREDMLPDRVHPSVEGYQFLARAMQPLVSEMMQKTRAAP